MESYWKVLQETNAIVFKSCALHHEANLSPVTVWGLHETRHLPHWFESMSFLRFEWMGIKVHWIQNGIPCWYGVSYRYMTFSASNTRTSQRLDSLIRNETAGNSFTSLSQTHPDTRDEILTAVWNAEMSDKQCTVFKMREEKCDSQIGPHQNGKKTWRKHNQKRKVKKDFFVLLLLQISPTDFNLASLAVWLCTTRFWLFSNPSGIQNISKSARQKLQPWIRPQRGLSKSYTHIVSSSWITFWNSNNCTLDKVRTPDRCLEGGADLHTCKTIHNKLCSVPCSPSVCRDACRIQTVRSSRWTQVSRT